MWPNSRKSRLASGDVVDVFPHHEVGERFICFVFPLPPLNSVREKEIENRGKKKPEEERLLPLRPIATLRFVASVLAPTFFPHPPGFLPWIILIFVVACSTDSLTVVIEIPATNPSVFYSPLHLYGFLSLALFLPPSHCAATALTFFLFFFVFKKRERECAAFICLFCC